MTCLCLQSGGLGTGGHQWWRAEVKSYMGVFLLLTLCDRDKSPEEIEAVLMFSQVLLQILFLTASISPEGEGSILLNFQGRGN